MDDPKQLNRTEQQVLLAGVEMLAATAGGDNPWDPDFNASRLKVHDKDKLTLGERAAELLTNARAETAVQMPWMRGVWLSPSTARQLENAIRDMAEHIDRMAKFEHCFNDGHDRSRQAFGGFITKLLTPTKVAHSDEQKE